MNTKRITQIAILFCTFTAIIAQNEKPIFSSKAYLIFPNRVVQDKFEATILSASEMSSNYKSNVVGEKNDIVSHWKMAKDIAAFPQYKSDYLISDAIYHLATEEMINAVEPDSTFRTGIKWPGVWTRDISYSIILSMAYLQPRVAKNSLLRKVQYQRIIQDTGTGGAYPASTDRMIWAVAAWEVYKVTGDLNWLKQAFQIIQNSMEDDLKNAFDPSTGLMRGESSFLDWREQTYPRWMEPVDIFESENLGTNAVHYQANIVLSKMAKVLNLPESMHKYEHIAATIKAGINTHFWMADQGYYGQYLYGRNFKIRSPRSEALGEALCVWFGIADKHKAQSIIANVPVMDYGISCIYPQIPNIDPYHNNAVWPFVQSYWALASAKVGNEQSVLESIAAIYRPAAFFLTNKENFVAESGDFAGTVVNSSNMLWSLSGNLSLVHKVLFGIEFQTDSLAFQPFIPKALAGSRSLTNFKCRNAILDIEMSGFGNKIKSFSVDGKFAKSTAISYKLKGLHKIKIVLSSTEIPHSIVNKVSNYTTIETPVANYTNETLTWSAIEGAKKYQILRNGKIHKTTIQTSCLINSDYYAEYQVIAIDANNISSFASEPEAVINPRFEKTYQLENFTPKAVYDYKGYLGDGFVEISKTVNRKVIIPIDIATTGTFTISFRYANGNGPINTENKCAIRTLKTDSKFAGTIVLPQRGVNEWSIWGMTNSVQIILTKGKHILTLTLESANENMNGDINQAMVDALIIKQLK